MFFTVKCKHCGRIQAFESQALEGEYYYKCISCGECMTDRESTKLTNIETLDNFEIVSINEIRIQNECNSKNFLRVISDIEEVFQSADDEVQKQIISFLDTSYLILNRADSDDKQTLFDTVRDIFSAPLSKCEVEVNQHIIESTSFEDLVRYIEDKIPGGHINQHGLNKLNNLYKKHGYALLIECVDISTEKYLKYDDNGIPTQDSVEVFFDKIGGIAHNKTLSPLDQKVRYLLNYGNKSFNYWKDNDAKVLLKQYVYAMKRLGYDDDEIIDDLNDRVVLLIDDSGNWSRWYNAMQELIKDLNEELV